MPRAKQQGAGGNGQPIQSTTGGKYGQRKMLEDSQRAVPIEGKVAPTGSPQEQAARVMGAAQAYQPPQIGLGAPTSRPGEAVTAGIDMAPAAPMNQPPNPDVIAMARYLPMLEAIASKPNASMTMRAFVRRLRSTLPPDFEFEG